MARNIYISIKSLNLNVLNRPTKKLLRGWVYRKQNLVSCCLLEIHFSSLDKHGLKMKGWETILPVSNDFLKSVY